MFIIQLEHPKTKGSFLMEWDLLKRRPAEGATLMKPQEFEAFVKKEKPEFSSFLPTAFANIKHHGTSHAIATAKSWIDRSYYKPSKDQQGGAYSVDKLFELHYFEKGSSKDEEIKKKSFRKAGE